MNISENPLLNDSLTQMSEKENEETSRKDLETIQSSIHLKNIHSPLKHLVPFQDNKADDSSHQRYNAGAVATVKNEVRAKKFDEELPTPKVIVKPLNSKIGRRSDIAVSSNNEDSVHENMLESIDMSENGPLNFAQPPGKFTGVRQDNYF